MDNNSTTFKDVEKNNTLTPDKIYRLYSDDERFKNCLVDTFEIAREEINKNFKGVSFTMYGRIKSENSYMLKSVMKKNIYDIYAFKIIVHNVSNEYISNNEIIKNSREKLKNLRIQLEKLKDPEEREKIISQIEDIKDVINIELTKEIADAFVADGSGFLTNLNAINLPERRDHHNKPNGYIAEHFTIEMDPKTEYNLKCLIEVQLISNLRNEMSKFNHDGYKQKEARPDVRGFEVSDFLKCETLEDFDKFCKGVPTYIVTKDNGDIVECSKHFSFLHFHFDFLFQSEYDENGKLKLKYPEAVEKLNSLYEDNKLLTSGTNEDPDFIIKRKAKKVQKEDDYR